MNMKGFVVSVALFLAALAPVACTRPEAEPEPTRVLFVGNSLVYTANLPAVFDALGEANGQSFHSEMLVQGGATLSQRVADGSVSTVLERGRYDYVVLQERGGDLVCFDAAACKLARDSIAAVQALAATAREHGATPLFLGTYQGMQRASLQLLEGEAQAATAAPMPLLPVSELYRYAVESRPDLPWHDADGMHPGPQLALLNAVLLYRELVGGYPDAVGFTVNAPMYTPRTRFFPPLLASEKVELRGDTVSGHSYSTDAVTAARTLARSPRP